MKAVLVVAVVLIATVLTAASGRAAVPSRIVFTADRAPSLSGKIYRLDPDGTLVNLSNSPFQDSGPTVSPDGQRVAFFSDRSGALSVWEVGIDGSGPVQVGPSLLPASTWQQDYSVGNANASSLAWQPGGDRLAAAAWNTLFILQPGHKPPTAFSVADSSRLNILGPWSPHGGVLVVVDYLTGRARAFSADGNQLWSVPHVESPYWSGWSGGGYGSGDWSRRGLVALPIGVGEHPRLRIYDESGRLRFAVHGTVSGMSGWSPDGKLLAAVVGGHAEVFTAAGRRVLRTRSEISRPWCRQVVWASDKRFIVGGFVQGDSGRNACPAFSVAVRTGTVSTASRLWLGAPLSADRKLTAFASQTGRQIAIGVRSTAHHAMATYGQLTACASKLGPRPVNSLQFAGPGHSLIYTTYCPYPPTILYSVASDGSDLQELASSSADCGTCANLAPQGYALSPDGTRIAAGGGYGGILIFDSSGGNGVQLTDPPTACNGLAGDKIPYQDTSPAWSPDGTTIVFTRTGCSGAGELYSVSAASGGVGRDLGILGDQAAWGPAKIAYVTFYGNAGVWTANPDGTDPVKVASSGRDPAWSQDGRLAYLTGSNTVVVDSTPIQLPFTDVNSLAWSPDGTSFVVTARTTSAGPFDVYTVDIDGTNPVQLTQNYDALATGGWR